jgi:hypothetical protein
MMYDWHDGGWGPAAWIAMGFMVVAFWGLVAVLVVYLTGNRGHGPAEQDDRTPDRSQNNTSARRF